MIEALTLFIMKKYFQVGEMILGFFGIAWGSWVLLPFFNTFEAEIYSSFYLVAEPHIWGISILTIGIATFFAANTKIYFLRKSVVFTNMVMWGFMSLMFSLSSLSSTAVPMYLVLGLYSFWQYIKLVVFVGIEKEVMSLG